MPRKKKIPPLRKSPVRRGQDVEVIAGKAKGSHGEVLRVDLKRHAVLIKGVNLLHKHTRPRRQGEKGGILSVEGPVHVSNVRLRQE